MMVVKPSERWRERVAEEARGLAAGTVDPSCAWAVELFPEPMLTATDAVLAAFDAEVGELREPSDARGFEAVERVVRSLNRVNEEFGGAAYETEEREELCAYIDGVLSWHGLDVAALAARRGLGRHEITDRWRDW
ncbi:hypothetical protein [Streptomyces sp. PT12]|uniref:hypothetical protein n=1 Tax=Streptomyces sp. PT12 TaxID=1510197 RepID=UPI00215BA8FA|nr:hypothetical protein [Streptomyces sp. PT12]